jgi:hypothetical protein
MYKTHEILMLSTNNSSRIYLTIKTNKLGLINGNNPEDLEQFPQTVVETQNQHLYLLSNETPQLNDWAIQYNDIGTEPKEIFQVKSIIPGECIVKKILATTDSSLTVKMIGNKVYDESKDAEFYGFKSGVGLQSHITEEKLLQFPTSLIELYVKMYNEGNPFTKIKVLYENVKYYAFDTTKEQNVNNLTNKQTDCILKLNSSNEFCYKPLKESSVSQEKMDNLLSTLNKFENMKEVDKLSNFEKKYLKDLRIQIENL